MLSSLQPHWNRQLWSGADGWRFFALIARWRNLRHAFSSVGSESGVPIDCQMAFQGMGKPGKREFQAASQLGLASVNLRATI